MKILLSFRKTTTAKVEVRLNVDQLPIEVVKSKDGILTRIIQKSKHLTKEGTDYVEWKNYLIPISSIHVSQENETGPQTSSNYFIISFIFRLPMINEFKTSL